MSHYGKSEYWDERYTKYFQFKNRQPEPFDWYQIYTGIKDVITQYIQKSHRILNIGAGNSSKILIYREDFLKICTKTASKQL